MKLAIVVPVFNAREYTEKFLPTVYSEHHEIKFFLIDNNSTDGTTKMFRDLCHKEAKYSFVRNDENKGVASSWNQGIKMAIAEGYERFLVCNNDILLRKDTIDNLMDLMTKEEFGFLTPINLREEVNAPEEVFEFVPKEITFAIHGAADFSCFLLTKACYEDTGEVDEGFKIAYFEDNDYVWRMHLANHKVGQTTGAMYYHFGSRTQNQVPGGLVEGQKFQKNKQYFIEKWGIEPVCEFEKMEAQYHKTPFNDANKNHKYTEQYG